VAGRARSIAILLLALVVLPACTAVEASGLSGHELGAITPEPWSPPRPATDTAYIATAISDTLAVYESPVPDAGKKTTILRREVGPVVLSIVGPFDPTALWLHVSLPQRPNGSTGWVDATKVAVTWTNLRLDIDLSERTIVLFDSNRPVLQASVAIGTAANPTPTGQTFVTELLANPNGGDMFGPFALGLALFSPTLTEYAGGNGRIGVHGTNQPDLLGSEASHGCLRVHNDVIREIAGRVPLGTPVDIHT
jgi:lipoprotein-anchoring transpeptidase ErfK/SrfK